MSLRIIEYSDKTNTFLIFIIFSFWLISSHRCLRSKQIIISTFLFSRLLSSIFRDASQVDLGNLTDTCMTLEQSDIEKLETQQFSLMVLLTCIIRLKSKTELPQMLRYSKDLVRDNIFTSLWVIQLFSYPQISRQFIIDCWEPVINSFLQSVICKGYEKIQYGYC